MSLPIIKPHAISPAKDTVHAIWFYYSFGATVCHIGLGVASNNTAKSLRAQGLWAELVPVTTGKQAIDTLNKLQATANSNGQLPISHVIISALWLRADEIEELVASHQNVHFTILCHSNVAFLAADLHGFKKLAHIADLTHTVGNLTLAGNSARFADWATQALRCDCAFLPNLYDLSTLKPLRQRPWNGGVLKIGCYGAPRVQKNIISAAAAALEMAEQLSTEVEFHVNVGRETNSGTLPPVRELMGVHRRGRLVEDQWSNWAAFRRVVGTMDVLMQPSWTESFNMVCADGIAEGVPTAVLDAIDWVPRNWIARLDDTSSLASVATSLLFNHRAAHEGQQSLKRYVQEGTRIWTEYLTSR